MVSKRERQQWSRTRSQRLHYAAVICLGEGRPELAYELRTLARALEGQSDSEIDHSMRATGLSVVRDLAGESDGDDQP